MYIESLIIQGFKSYKDSQILDPFSPKHNVVVGRNGSGKSNFFWAIRFVLGDAYSQMTREERQSLLHEGQGSVISAFVEILFDNEDLRFPTGKDKVILRRSIGLKKDEYSLDKKTVTKSEVHNLLESAGFSRSNPYYIVPQGRVTALTNSRDPERLALLKDVAGTKVYTQKRLESIKIMDETLGKRDQIGGLLEYIEDRLGELEQEKKELNEFSRSDKDRRCLEYALYTREQSEAHEQLEQLDSDRNAHSKETVDLYASISERQLEITQAERELTELRQRLTLAEVEREATAQDISEALKTKAQIGLEVNDLSLNVKESNQTRTQLLKEKQKLEREISGIEKQLATILPDFQNLLVEEKNAKNGLEDYESQLEYISSKRGRHDRFKNQAERDVWLNNSIQELQNVAQSTQTQLKSLQEGHGKTQGTIQQLRDSLDPLKERLIGRRALLEQVDAEFQKCKQNKEDLEGERKNLWREEAKISSTFESLKQELEKNNRSISSTMDRNTSKGLASVARIVERLGIRGYFGPLYELFTVEDSLQTATEVVAGASLFHLVVDTDETASKILEVLTKERGGRVTFMPLNRLNPRETVFPDSEQAIPLISRLEFDPQFRSAMLQVFGKAVLAPNLEEASAYARSHQLTGITFDGDRADRKGALTGGFHEFSSSRLQCIAAMRLSRQRMREDTIKLKDIRQRLANLDGEILMARDKLAAIDAKKRAVLAGRDPIQAEIAQKTQKLEQAEGFYAQEEQSILGVSENLAELEHQIDLAQKEKASAFRKKLDDRESDLLKRLPDLVAQAHAKYSNIVSRRTAIESRKNQLEISVNSNLSRSLVDIEAKLEGLEVVGDDAELGLHRNQLKEIEETIQNVNDHLRELEETSDELTENISKLQQRLEKSMAAQRDDQASVERKQRSVDKFLARKTVMVQKKETALSHIRSLGVLPDEAFSKYVKTDGRDLLTKLHKVNETLKKFSHVNKKAFEQYENFTKQRETLQDRKEELDTSAKSIEKLIITLDQRKNEAIDVTFEQVAINFKEVWKRLVPEGEGDMVMVRRADDAMLETPSQSQSAAVEIEKYTGVSLNVSFVPGQQLRMAQLSGGQKSLVSLALIFAIQKCDPAPFYLFDEIDAALDTQYRSAVADMVKDLSRNAQFITTTFRPELLVNADKFYGVTFANKVSKIQSITKAEANQFVEAQTNPAAPVAA